MSYSSLLSMAAAGGDSPSLDALSSRFAHLPSRRTSDAAYPAVVASSYSPRGDSTAVAATAFLAAAAADKRRNRDSMYHADCPTSSNSKLDSLLTNCGSEETAYPLTAGADSSAFADYFFAAGAELSASDASPTSAGASSTPGFDNGNDDAVTATPAFSGTTTAPPVTSFFAAQKPLYSTTALGKLDTDSTACRGGGGVVIARDADVASSPASSSSSSATRVENVEWHMLDKRKFYPMSTVCSFFIRGTLFPFTLIKTRIQIQEQKEMYRGTYDALRKIYAAEGVGGFYRGFWVNSMQVFSGIFYISTYEGVRHLMSTQFDVHGSVVRSFAGGLCASVVGQMITVPMDVVSQHMMLIGSAHGTGTKRLKIAKHDAIYVPPEALKTRFGAFQTIMKEIHARHGFPGYYRGYWISVCTYAPNSALWWGFYQWYIDLLSKVLPHSIPALMVQACSAPAAGLSAAVLTNPIDVVRARVQVEGNCSARQAAARLWQEESYRMFTKGLSARFIQSSFFSFLIILGYETVKRLSLKEEYKHLVPW